MSWVYRQKRHLKAGHSTAIPLLKLGKYLRIPTAALLARLQGPDTTREITLVTLLGVTGCVLCWR